MSTNEIIVDLKEDQQEETLLLPTFEKENLRIKSGSKTFNEFYEETQGLRENIAQTANSLLYHWKNVTIVFPQSLTGLCDGINLETIDHNFDHKNTFANSLFILPTFNELDEVSVDSNGRTKKLDKEQLKSVKKYGEFEVKSIHFPGQTHKWRLARWLQLGYAKSNEYFFQNLATALKLLIITAKNRILSNRFSLTAGAKSMYRGSVRLIDMLIGLPAMCVLPYETELADEERKFLVAELTVDEKEQEKYEKYCEEIRERLKPKSTELYHKFVIPYFFRTRDNLLIDFRLFDRDLMTNVLIILKKLTKETENDRKWFSKLRKSLCEKFKSEGLSDADTAEKAKEIINQEFSELVFQRILKSEEIERLSPRLGITLVNHARAILIMRECKNTSISNLNKHIQEYEKSIKKKYSIRSNITVWLSNCLEKERKAFAERTKYFASEMAIDELRKHDLKQAAYFIDRELIFRKNPEKVLENEFKKRKTPVKEFTIYRRIWFPKDWIVTKYEPDKETIVVKPNIFSDRFSPRNSCPLVNEACYALSRTYEYRNNTKYPFWRWKNFFLRTWAYFCNSLYIFGILIPFYSPISFSALFRPKAFYPDKKIDERTGKIHVNESKKILTFASRIRAIWRHIIEARAQFELQPDKGLIGKTFQRFFNRIWNYIFKGIIGTASVVIVMPILCFTLSMGSIILAILTPIWYPIFSLLLHIGFSLIFDWDYPYSTSIGNRFLVLFHVIIWRFLICGLFQPAAALITSFILCPFSSIIVSLYACLRKLMSSLSDNLMFYLVLKPRARVPSHDTFVARRYAGPGLASNHFYQIKIEQALAAVEANLEVNVLDAYIGYIENVIGEPESKYCQFFNTLFQPFSCNVTLNTKSAYDYLVREKNDYLEKFRKIASKRHNVLKASISKSDLSRIRLNESDLNIVLMKSTEIIRTQHLKNILPYLKKSEKDFFRENDIDDNDWSLYSGIYLENIFGNGFLTPLESTDTVFQLDINHLNLSKYSSMIANSELRDDLDSFKTRYNPKGSHYTISMPYLDESIFQTSNSDDHNDKLLKVPSRLPAHPGIISILLYNRDNQDKQIKFDDQNQIDNIIEANRTNTIEY